MTDTAQPVTAADPVAAAADAFKSFMADEPIVQRDDKGRFAKAEEAAEEIEELEEAEAQEAEADTDDDGEEEAAEEAQPTPMPASWSKEDADFWETLPAEAQGKIVAREAQREQAVNQKFQEAANAKKATEAELAAANANRDAYRDAIDQVLALVQPVAPDPREYGAGTGNYNREAYDLAVLDYNQTLQNMRALQQQRQVIAAQQEAEAKRVFDAEIEAIESIARPRFLADVPELTQPDKAPQVLNDIVRYAIEAGIPESVFQGDAISGVTSAEMHIAWKAMQYDKIKGAQAKVKETPAPKAATPAVKPGVAISRSATKQANMRKASDRLATEGSIEAGAAVWKNFL